jgi:hypothetical protein
MDMCRVIAACIQRGPDNTAHRVVGHERIHFIDMLRAFRKARRLRSAIAPIPLTLLGLGVRAATLVTDRPPFDENQLEALQVPDQYDPGDWSERFGVSFTPFRHAVEEVVRSRWYRHRHSLVSPHGPTACDRCGAEPSAAGRPE